MKRITLLTIAMTLTFAFGCDKAEKTAATAEPATEPTVAAAQDDKAPASGHAPAGAEPGSHEDWCGGHMVPESMCTRCNPTLIAGFKATGDWCAEHNMPESQCITCNPELKIERPAKKVAQ